VDDSGATALPPYESEKSGSEKKQESLLDRFRNLAYGAQSERTGNVQVARQKNQIFPQ
jgi:hypothetical protein